MKEAEKLLMEDNVQKLKEHHIRLQDTIKERLSALEEALNIQKEQIAKLEEGALLLEQMQAELKSLNRPIGVKVEDAEALLKSCQDLFKKVQDIQNKLEQLKAQDHIAEQIRNLLLQYDKIIEGVNDHIARAKQAMLQREQFYASIKEITDIISSCTKMITIIQKTEKTTSEKLTKFQNVMDQVTECDVKLIAAHDKGEQIGKEGTTADRNIVMEDLQSLKDQLNHLRKSVQKLKMEHENMMAEQKKLADDLEELLEKLRRDEAVIRSRPMLSLNVDSVDNEMKKHQALAQEVQKRLEMAKTLSQNVLKELPSGNMTETVHQTLSEINLLQATLPRELQERHQFLDTALISRRKYNEAKEGLTQWLDKAEKLIIAPDDGVQFENVAAKLVAHKTFFSETHKWEDQLGRLEGLAQKIRPSLQEGQVPLLIEELDTFRGRLERTTLAADKRRSDLEKDQLAWQEYINVCDKIRKCLQTMKLPDERPTTIASIRVSVQNVSTHLNDVQKNQDLINNINVKARSLDRRATPSTRTSISNQIANINQAWQDVLCHLEGQLTSLTDILNQWEVYTEVYTRAQSSISLLENKLENMRITHSENEQQLQVVLSEARGLKDLVNDVGSLSSGVLKYLSSTSEAAANVVRQEVQTLVNRYNRLLLATEEGLKQIEEEKAVTDTLQAEISALNVAFHNMESDISNLDCFDPDVDALDTTITEMQQHIGDLNQQVKTLSDNTKEHYAEKKRSIPEPISKSLSSVEILSESVSAGMEEREREFKRARTVRWEYMQGIETIVAWMQNAQEQLQDKSCLLQIAKEIITTLLSELPSMKDIMEQIQRNGRLIMENARNLEEKDVIRSTITSVSNQFSQVEAWIEERRREIEDALASQQQFLQSNKLLKEWLSKIDNLLAQEVQLTTLAEAKQKLAEYQGAACEITQAQHYLTDMGKYLERISNVCNAGDLGEILDEVEQDESSTESRLQEEVALLQEMVEEWEQCERKIKEVTAWMEKSRNSLDSPQTKRKGLRDQITIREKILADMTIQKTKVMMAIEKLQVHLRSKASSKNEVIEKGQCVQKELDQFQQMLNEQCNDLGKCLNQEEKYQQDIQQLQHLITQAEHQQKLAANTTIPPEERDKLLELQNALKDQIKKYQQQITELQDRIKKLNQRRTPDKEPYKIHVEPLPSTTLAIPQPPKIYIPSSSREPSPNISPGRRAYEMRQSPVPSDIQKLSYAAITSGRLSPLVLHARESSPLTVESKLAKTTLKREEKKDQDKKSPEITVKTTPIDYSLSKPQATSAAVEPSGEVTSTIETISYSHQVTSKVTKTQSDKRSALEGIKIDSTVEKEEQSRPQTPDSPKRTGARRKQKKVHISNEMGDVSSPSPSSPKLDIRFSPISSSPDQAQSPTWASGFISKPSYADIVSGRVSPRPSTPQQQERLLVNSPTPDGHMMSSYQREIIKTPEGESTVEKQETSKFSHQTFTTHSSAFSTITEPSDSTRLSFIQPEAVFPTQTGSCMTRQSISPHTLSMDTSQSAFHTPDRHVAPKPLSSQLPHSTTTLQRESPVLAHPFSVSESSESSQSSLKSLETIRKIGEEHQISQTHTMSTQKQVRTYTPTDISHSDSSDSRKLTYAEVAKSPVSTLGSPLLDRRGRSPSPLFSMKVDTQLQRKLIPSPMASPPSLRRHPDSSTKEILVKRSEESKTAAEQDSQRSQPHFLEMASDHRNRPKPDWWEQVEEAESKPAVSSTSSNNQSEDPFLGQGPKPTGQKNEFRPLFSSEGDVEIHLLNRGGYGNSSLIFPPEELKNVDSKSTSIPYNQEQVEERIRGKEIDFNVTACDNGLEKREDFVHSDAENKELQKPDKDKTRTSSHHPTFFNCENLTKDFYDTAYHIEQQLHINFCSDNLSTRSEVNGNNNIERQDLNQRSSSGITNIKECENIGGTTLNNSNKKKKSKRKKKKMTVEAEESIILAEDLSELSIVPHSKSNETVQGSQLTQKNKYSKVSSTKLKMSSKRNKHKKRRAKTVSISHIGSNDAITSQGNFTSAQDNVTGEILICISEFQPHSLFSDGHTSPSGTSDSGLSSLAKEGILSIPPSPEFFIDFPEIETQPHLARNIQISDITELKLLENLIRRHRHESNSSSMSALAYLKNNIDDCDSQYDVEDDNLTCSSLEHPSTPFSTDLNIDDAKLEETDEWQCKTPLELSLPVDICEHTEILDEIPSKSEYVEKYLGKHIDQIPFTHPEIHVPEVRNDSVIVKEDGYKVQCTQDSTTATAASSISTTVTSQFFWPRENNNNTTQTSSPSPPVDTVEERQKKQDESTGRIELANVEKDESFISLCEDADDDGNEYAKKDFETQGHFSGNITNQGEISQTDKHGQITQSKICQFYAGEENTQMSHTVTSHRRVIQSSVMTTCAGFAGQTSQVIHGEQDMPTVVLSDLHAFDERSNLTQEKVSECRYLHSVDGAFSATKLESTEEMGPEHKDIIASAKQTVSHVIQKSQQIASTRLTSSSTQTRKSEISMKKETDTMEHATLFEAFSTDVHPEGDSIPYFKSIQNIEEFDRKHASATTTSQLGSL